MRRIVTAALLLVVILSSRHAARSREAGQPAADRGAATASSAAPPRRVLIFAFDNTSLADLQAMPTLWRFIQGGALSTNHHTVLPSRSAPGFAAIATGRYADRTGALDNSFFIGDTRETGFTFWETRLESEGSGSGAAFGVGEPPWAAFNAGGWDVGAVGMNPLVLQTEDDVRNFSDVGNPDAPDPAAYRGVALYRADGTRVFGAPNIPWLWQAVGGFPGWPLRAVEYPLTATALMQEHGIGVTFTYLENLRGASRPGEYEGVRQRYEAAFAAFFARLAADGITPENSLFVFTTDEGDHLVEAGGRSIGIRSWLPGGAGISAPIRVTGGAAAGVYAGPESDSFSVASALSAMPGVQAIAWGAALRAAHLSVVADPARTPAVLVFGDDDVQFRVQGGRSVTRTPAPLWNHGTLGADMERVWLAIRGPYVRSGVLEAWTDHTDLLPTVHHLLGLPDAGLDGRVIVEALTDDALPAGADRDSLARLGAAFKLINAPTGTFSHAALRVSTRAASADAARASLLDAELAALVDERDALAAEVQTLLRGGRTERESNRFTTDALLARAENLLMRVAALASDSPSNPLPEREGG